MSTTFTTQNICLAYNCGGQMIMSEIIRFNVKLFMISLSGNRPFYQYVAAVKNLIHKIEIFMENLAFSEKDYLIFFKLFAKYNKMKNRMEHKIRGDSVSSYQSIINKTKNKKQT
jgi:hypothetical protein